MQRGREEVRVYVRLPEEERNTITDIEGFQLRTPGGGEVTAKRVASLRVGRSPTAIRRQDGQRVVRVSADVDPAVISGGQANGILEDDILGPLLAADPGLTYTFGGEQKEQLESMNALGPMFGIAMILIFALLAIPLSSYTKPFIIMAIVPFGFIGVVLGHLILGVWDRDSPAERTKRCLSLDLVFLAPPDLLWKYGVKAFRRTRPPSARAHAQLRGVRLNSTPKNGIMGSCGT